ncbi:MAG: amidohydrolase [Ignavibacteria bacterium]|nr:amidohydrolase [Ignavibacteria bacterium]
MIKSPLKLALSVIILVFLFSSCGRKPEVIFINGKIYTLDKNNAIVEAIAVSDGKILALGKSSELTENYPSAKTIDLGGKTVIPGFIDAEGNLMEFSKQLSLIDLRNAKSLEEIKQLVRDRVKQSEPGEWIGGFGWDELKLTEKDLERLHHKILDSISTDHQIYLVNALGNTTWVNNRVLEIAKITKDTPDPEGGEIGFDENNQPTGLFYDMAQQIIIDLLPQPSEQQVMKNLERGIGELLKYGITELSDANVTEQGLNVYKKMTDEGKFPIRIYGIISGKGSLFEKYLSNGPEDYKEKVIIKCAGLEFDGYFETQDAAMIDDYKSDPKRMTPYNDEYDIKEMVKRAFEKGFQVSVKTVGDRAVNQTLNAIESASREVKSPTDRIRLEYCEFVRPEDMQRIRQMRIIPSVRPEITLTNKLIASELIRNENLQNLGLWNTLFKQNNIIISGTDFPYHMINPLIQIYYLTTGLSLDTADNRISNNSSQKLSIIDAVKSFTVYSAYANFCDDIKGSLEKDKFADMIVLSEDIFTSDPSVLLNTKVLKTIIRGEILFDATGGSASSH